MLAYSSVAQAGYMLVGVVVSTRLGVQATVFYLGAYLVMNIAAFAVIAVRERETDTGDDISSLYGLGAARPGAGVADDDRHALARRLPRHGRVLRQALPDPGRGRQRVRVARRRDRARLGDLARVLPAGRRGGVDAVALGGGRARPARLRRAPRPVIAGGSPEADEPEEGSRRAGRRERRARPPRRSRPPSRRAGSARASPRSCSSRSCARSPRSRLGIYPDPLLDLARDAGAALSSLV